MRLMMEEKTVVWWHGLCCGCHDDVTLILIWKIVVIHSLKSLESVFNDLHPFFHSRRTTNSSIHWQTFLINHPVCVLIVNKSGKNGENFLYYKFFLFSAWKAYGRSEDTPSKYIHRIYKKPSILSNRDSLGPQRVLNKFNFSFNYFYRVYFQSLCLKTVS